MHKLIGGTPAQFRTYKGSLSRLLRWSPQKALIVILVIIHSFSAVNLRIIVLSKMDARAKFDVLVYTIRDLLCVKGTRGRLSFLG